MQRLLFCGYPDSAILPVLEMRGLEVLQTMEPLTEMPEVDGLVSFGYPHVIPEHLLARLPRKGVNLHISLLPWNRGKHPNFWAFHDGTPHGVTLHEIEPGLDTGAILLQRGITLDPERLTFREAWMRLLREAEDLFLEHLDAYLDGRLVAKPQGGPGSYHRSAQLPEWAGGWDANIAEAIAGLHRQASEDAARVLGVLVADPACSLDPVRDKAILRRALLANPGMLRAMADDVDKRWTDGMPLDATRMAAILRGTWPPPSAGMD
ncbi:MAG: formyltransferase family protein [Candidatus Sericytochromatia bacterium]|nr:formyltransferase family protein [Candidatus Sericytochromatia bacterium]